MAEILIKCSGCGFSRKIGRYSDSTKCPNCGRGRIKNASKACASKAWSSNRLAEWEESERKRREFAKLEWEIIESQGKTRELMERSTRLMIESSKLIERIERRMTKRAERGRGGTMREEVNRKIAERKRLRKRHETHNLIVSAGLPSLGKRR